MWHLGLLMGKYTGEGLNIADLELILEVKMVFKPSGLYIANGSINKLFHYPQLFSLIKEECQVRQPHIFLSVGWEGQEPVSMGVCRILLGDFWCEVPFLPGLLCSHCQTPGNYLHWPWPWNIVKLLGQNSTHINKFISLGPHRIPNSS